MQETENIETPHSNRVVNTANLSEAARAGERELEDKALTLVDKLVVLTTARSTVLSMDTGSSEDDRPIDEELLNQVPSNPDVDEDEDYKPTIWCRRFRHMVSEYCCANCESVCQDDGIEDGEDKESDQERSLDHEYYQALRASFDDSVQEEL